MVYKQDQEQQAVVLGQKVSECCVVWRVEDKSLDQSGWLSQE